MNHRKIASWVTYALFPMSVCSWSAENSQYTFDESLFLGGDFGKGLKRFNADNNTPAGKYSVDIYLNGRFIQRDSVDFVNNSAQKESEPCLSREFYVQSGVNESALPQGDELAKRQCKSPEALLKGASWSFDQPRLRLDLYIPQALLTRSPRDAVPVESWDAGESLMFLNYSTNYYQSRYRSGSGGTSQYGFLGLKSGINLGLWQLRQQSSATYSQSPSRSRYQWQSLQTYMQRPIAALDSNLMIGQSYSGGSLFGSMAYNGVKLETDQRMWPQSRRGYAPEIRGTAQTNARVVVSQNGRTIYETNVPQGPFVIDDLSSTHYEGDLKVEIIEADGRSSTFTVPFSAVPDSMRPGVSRYNAVVGRARDYGDTQNLFGDFTYERGISNSFTGNLGLRIADDYQAILAGGVWSHWLGAFGLNTTWSHAQIDDNQSQSGWRVQASYSRTFDYTGTNVALAGYRYSTEGYRELSDVLGERASKKHGSNNVFKSDTLNQRNQFTAMINQSLGDYGSLYLSGSVMDYYDNQSRNTQLQVGYSNSWKNISYNLAISRQQSVYRNQIDMDGSEQGRSRSYLGNTENLITLTFSIPLSFGGRDNYISTSLSHADSSGNSGQTSVSGMLDDAGTLNYSVYAGYQQNRESQAGSTKNWGANLQKNSAFGTLNGSYSASSDYTQWGVGGRGAAVIHRGGITLGPYLSETFGLVEAKGAKGALVKNGQGARIDSNGYAIVPSLTPYRYNTISLDPKGINKHTELKSTQSRVIPYAGAAVKASFDTLSGYGVLIKAKINGTEALPMGASVLDDQNNVVGMSGQASLIYARVRERQGILTVKWGDSPQEMCRVSYVLPESSEQQELVSVAGQCVVH
ncbi:fimbrial biogenesis outer membrane usher protein [Hafnia paralvei]|uniref:fimbria/pilus outer membrane usher protein n=2 Tax=Hafnia paralvei TaxID=546367 RepID=UPI000DF4086C|nr:fimbria/pilus outer membrane usher protein [Hafnia paralvei]RDA63994.1 fimbrial biogenesis outer membrane usher protein [Hafnia paralvei]RDA64737.1 fimbrial biogenesis outer membrane usher protein [Hafnia paralvei]RDA65734.1 fimbrial biogenesis outer membrane usher protein [Hafnia paralvei]RDA76371.1 fimbrial biogenesis outer membrane usher protein [Hafnia paralvei]RDA76878.1 fimbrial biogenesis outer membrane usher protein [Hafnia paralvei]